jgi:hypothetical protein
MQAPKQPQLLLLHAPQPCQALAWAAQALAVQRQQHCLLLQSSAALVASGRRQMAAGPLLLLLLLLLLPALPARYCLCGDACQAS